MKITYDKYTNKYFLYFSESNVVAFTLEELEELKGELGAVISEAYERQLSELDMGDDCESGACKI